MGLFDKKCRVCGTKVKLTTGLVSAQVEYYCELRKKNSADYYEKLKKKFYIGRDDYVCGDCLINMLHQIEN